jgi:EAL domain-containing protein (putative c-di-GMP-specific phosphodiesterase class I)
VLISDDLAVAIGRGELELYYEPQVELCTGRIVGMEALVCWNHPMRGLLIASAFLPIAEKSGAITVIGQWVIDRACRQMSLWREAGTAPQTLAINIPYSLMKKGDELVQFVTDALAKWGVAPGELELGVTESVMARAAMAQNDVLERLQSVGIKISIDDFGIRCSTFDYLGLYRVDRIKIAQSLIDGATQDGDGAAMVRAIVGMARELGIEVVAPRAMQPHNAALGSPGRG